MGRAGCGKTTRAPQARGLRAPWCVHRTRRFSALTWLPLAGLMPLALFPSPARGQSLFATRGLGVPVAPLDARARVLGGVGVGLLGLNPSLVNPAEVAGLRRRGISVASQPSSRSMQLEGEEAGAGATRFPLLRILYPVGNRLVTSLGYGGYLDQSWGVVTERREVIGQDTVPVRDLVESSGGIAQLQLSAAYVLSPALAVGAAVGLYTGSLEREVTRTFEDTTLTNVQRFQTRLRWGYRGPQATIGLRWDPLPVLRLASSVTWAGELEAEGEEGDARDRSFDLPWQIAGGASAWLAPRILAGISAQWTGWAAAQDDFADPDLATNAWELGGGLEWEASRAGERVFPLRLGFHYGQFPFKLQGETPAEWSVALGIGARFAGDEGGPLAVVDAAAERGGRGDRNATGLTESFWRLTVSLSLFGR